MIDIVYYETEEHQSKDFQNINNFHSPGEGSNSSSTLDVLEVRMWSVQMEKQFIIVRLQAPSLDTAKDVLLKGKTGFSFTFRNNIFLTIMWGKIQKIHCNIFNSKIAKTEVFLINIKPSASRLINYLLLKFGVKFKSSTFVSF